MARREFRRHSSRTRASTTRPSYHSGPPAIGSSSKPGYAGSEAIGLGAQMYRQALPQVERLIIEGKKRIARQRDVVAAAFQEGRDTEIPVSMLRAFEASLRAFERHRQLIVDRQKKPERG